MRIREQTQAIDRCVEQVRSAVNIVRSMGDEMLGSAVVDMPTPKPQPIRGDNLIAAIQELDSEINALYRELNRFQGQGEPVEMDRNMVPVAGYQSQRSRGL